jgi:hypothetical protein
MKILKIMWRFKNPKASTHALQIANGLATRGCANWISCGGTSHWRPNHWQEPRKLSG